MQGEDKKTAKSPMHLCSFMALHACHLLPANGRYRSETTSLQHLFCLTNDYYSSPPYHHLWLLQGHWYHFPFSCSQICGMVLTTNSNTFILSGLQFLAVRSVYFCSGTYLIVSSGDKLPSFVGGWFFGVFFQHDPDSRFRLYSLKFVLLPFTRMGLLPIYLKTRFISIKQPYKRIISIWKIYGILPDCAGELNLLLKNVSYYCLKYKICWSVFLDV